MWDGVYSSVLSKAFNPVFTMKFTLFEIWIFPSGDFGEDVGLEDSSEKILEKASNSAALERRRLSLRESFGSLLKLNIKYLRVFRINLNKKSVMHLQQSECCIYFETFVLGHDEIS